MARPKKITRIDENMPVKASETALTVFLLQDPTAKSLKRIIRVHGAEERDRLVNRGWVHHG